MQGSGDGQLRGDTVGGQFGVAQPDLIVEGRRRQVTGLHALQVYTADRGVPGLGSERLSVVETPRVRRAVVNGSIV